MKKFFQITFLILCAVFILKKDKIKKYFAEQRYYSYLLNHNILKHCYSPCQDLITIFSQEGFDYYKYDQQITKDSLKKLQDPNIKIEDIPKIPTILHKIHLVAQDSPEKLNSFYFEELKLNFNNFNNLNSTWKYIIWTNKPELFSEMANIKNLEIKHIKEFESHPYYEIFDNMIIKGQKIKTYLGKASNILKLMALQKFGGIYSDNDYEVYKPEELVKLMKKFDFIGVRESIKKESYYSNSFIAAKANHPIIKDSLEKRRRNYYFDIKDPDIPLYLKYPCNLHDKMIIGSAASLTISYFAKNNIDENNDIILPSWMMINEEFARLRSNNCNLSEITPESFGIFTKNLPSVLKDFISNPKLKDWQYTFNSNDSALQNIYYNLKYRKDFDIIGADPACASWAAAEHHKKKYLYFNYPWQWKLAADETQSSTNQTCQ